MYEFKIPNSEFQILYTARVAQTSATLLAISVFSALLAAHHSQAPDAEDLVVRQYCVGCHNDRGKAGGLSFASFESAHAAEHAAVAERMIRKLRAGMMPPPGARRPDAATLTALAASLENRVDQAALAAPNPGWRPFQRLTRAEYARAIKDLLALDIDAAALLPPDTISAGFDNVADAQAFSPR